jgi:hypothetical protein
VLDFDGPVPHRERLAARVLQRAACVTSLFLLPPLPGRHRWTQRQDPLVEDVHVRQITCSSETGGMPAATDALLSQPLPQAPHPPWDVSLFHFPGQRRFRIVYRVHHALQDGVGAAHAMLTLLADRATPGPRPHRAALPTAGGLLLAGRSFLNTLDPGRGWAEWRSTPSYRTRWTYADATESHLREVASRHGVTVNDVCLAGLAGALARWHRSLPEKPQAVPKLSVLVPMSFRQSHERYAVGNRVTAYRLTLPCHLDDMTQALRHIHRQTCAVRTHRVRDVSRIAQELLPATLVRPLSDAMVCGTARSMFTSSITLPAEFTCLDGRLSAASLICDLFSGRLGWISFTRAASVVRCSVVGDDALPRAMALPDLWREAVGAGRDREHTAHHRSSIATPPVSEDRQQDGTTTLEGRDPA